MAASQEDKARRQRHLEGVYEARSPDELAMRYGDWAADYDRDVTAMGYQVPAVVAAMTARHLPRNEGPILDCGAGTGLLGLLLAALGYGPLTAIDLSRDMLALAKSRGAYACCRRMVLGERLDFPDAVFAACVASGVFTAGHAPPESFEELLRVTRPGGYVIFGERSDGPHARAYRSVCSALEAAGRWRLVETSQPYRPFSLAVEEAHMLNIVYVYRRSDAPEGGTESGA